MKLRVKEPKKENSLGLRGQILPNLIEDNRLLSNNENLAGDFQHFVIQINLIPRSMNSQDLFQVNEVISISDSEVLLLLVYFYSSFKNVYSCLIFVAFIINSVDKFTLFIQISYFEYF